VNRSTIHRYLVGLSTHIYIDDNDGNRLKIDRSAYLVNVRFTLHEAMAIHLATRLLAISIPDHNPHAASALRKLSISIKRLAPTISGHMGATADQMDADERNYGRRVTEILQLLTLAWADCRKVKIHHLHGGDNAVYEYTLCPYFIEPYSAGNSVQVIGLSQSLKGQPKLRTFKLERIDRVELLNERYLIPKEFNPQALLQDAWGIWYTNEPPERVLLKFSPQVAARVRMTHWHPSQQLYENPDGSIIWEGWIAEPREMEPWIRGWGSDCEVLAPTELRERMRVESKKWYDMYHEGCGDGSTKETY